MQTRRLISRVLVVIFAVVQAGCFSAQDSVQIPAPEPQPKEYIVGPEDVLEIYVWQNEDLCRTVMVRSDGMISLPLAGDIEAAGRSPEQLAAEVIRKLKPYIGKPVVAVIVKEMNSKRIFVQGEVNRSGAYPIRTPTTLPQAIAIAGGFAPFARTSQIKIIRTEKAGARIIKVNYKKIVSGEIPPEDTLLAPGDTIIVP